MARPGLAGRFWQDGFLVIEHFFDAVRMDELDGPIRAHFGADPDYRHSDEFLFEAQTEVIPWFPRQAGGSAFDAIDAHPGLKSLTTEILGEGWRSDYCMVMFSRKGSAGQAWHQDCPCDDPAQHNLNRLVYTADITDAVGGQVVIVPGSHKMGMLPPGDPTGHFPGEVVLKPGKGTLILLHGHIWHRVLPITGGFRYSTNYRAAPKSTREGVTDVCVYRNMLYQFSTSRIIEKRV
ncbi:MAG: phytanoyl-CoA dioxygenase family protein [Gammaproteobacteria bacterium]|nr:phytanoyl-CoA dioxygenase family protein [Gammaproteobacteria bacterium]